MKSVESAPKWGKGSHPAHPNEQTAHGPRTSLLFTQTDRLPEQRSGDKSTHRLYHHYYEDLLM